LVAFHKDVLSSGRSSTPTEWHLRAWMDPTKEAGESCPVDDRLTLGDGIGVPLGSTFRVRGTGRQLA
jgi:hypothetical protein